MPLAARHALIAKNKHAEMTAMKDFGNLKVMWGFQFQGCDMHKGYSILY